MSRRSVALVTLAFVALALIGCQQKLSEIYKTQLIQYLKDGGKLATQSGEGISLLTLQSQLTDAKAAFDLLAATWPPGFAPAARESFNASHKGYDLAIRLWKDKINKSDEPTEPDINGWSSYLAYAGGALTIDTHASDFIVESYRGKRYLPFDNNISALLTLAATHFGKGRQLVLRELE